MFEATKQTTALQCEKNKEKQICRKYLHLYSLFTSNIIAGT